jgi:glycosyltransferase involved in cell wall biosynthesis
MKILIVTDNFPPANWGGAASVAFDEAAGLANLGQQVFVFTITADKNKIGWHNSQNLKIYSFYSSYYPRWRAWLSLFNPFIVFKFRKELEKLQPDIVHFHNLHYHFSYYCLKISKKLKYKTFITLHDVMSFYYGKLCSPEYTEPQNKNIRYQFNYHVSAWDLIKCAGKRFNPFRNLIIRHYLKYADTIIAVSSALSEALNQNEIKNSIVLHNGLDYNLWNKSAVSSNLKKELGLKNKKIILTLGRLGLGKGIDKLISALSKVIVATPEAVLVLVGSNLSSQEFFQKLTVPENLKNNIYSLPPVKREELPYYYSLADVVAVPSVCFDSFPTINLEAGACAKPVIATHFGGSPEIIKDNENGFIINPFNIEMLAEKIIYLLKNPVTAEELGEHARQNIQDNFTLQNHLTKLINIYKS